MAKIIAFDQDAQESMRRGVAKLAKSRQSDSGTTRSQRHYRKELWIAHRHQGRGYGRTRNRTV